MSQNMRYPTVMEGVVEKIVCFDTGVDSPCGDRMQAVGVVRCGGFLLWRLPDANNCAGVYCTAPSGL